MTKSRREHRGWSIHSLSHRRVKRTAVGLAFLASVIFTWLPVVHSHGVSAPRFDLVNLVCGSSSAATDTCDADHSSTDRDTHSDRNSTSHDQDSCPLCHLICQVRQTWLPPTDFIVVLSAPSDEFETIPVEDDVDLSSVHLPISGPRAPPAFSQTHI